MEACFIRVISDTLTESGKKPERTIVCDRPHVALIIAVSSPPQNSEADHISSNVYCLSVGVHDRSSGRRSQKDSGNAAKDEAKTDESASSRGRLLLDTAAA